MHQVHVSITQIEFDQTRQSVEVVIRVFADDLENALSRHLKRPVKIDAATDGRNKEAGEMAIAYLRSCFELRSKNGRQVKLNWAGMEGQADLFWLYIEGKMPGGIDGAQLKNRIFFELFDDQVNIVNTIHRGKQIGLMYEVKDGMKVITEKS